MSDIQILTLCLSIVIPLSMLIYSNTKINDAKEVLRAEMQAGFERLLGEIREVKAMLKQHELEHHR